MLDKLISTLSNFINDESASCNIFTILDAAQHADIAWKPYEFQTDWLSLYKGEPEEVLSDVAPYIVTVAQNGTANHPLINWIIDDLWDKNCAIILQSRASLQALQQYLQKLLIVMDESGNSLYFRYYDPRILKVYLPTCTAEELALFFGPVENFIIRNEDDESDSIYSIERGELKITPLPIKNDA